jgi:hypothetical protein
MVAYIHGAFSFTPLADSPCSPCWLPLYPISTYLAPSSCDRNRPPPSQVACKLTLFAPPPFAHLSHPFQPPKTPTAQRLTMTTLGLFRSCYAEQVPPWDWTRVPHDRKQTGGPLDQWNCVRMQWDCRLCTMASNNLQDDGSNGYCPSSEGIIPLIINWTVNIKESYRFIMSLEG